MSLRSFTRTVRIELKRLAAPGLLLLSALTALPCHSQEKPGVMSTNSLPEAASTDVEAPHRYHLPRSNNHSIYFLPGSAELGESARQVLVDTAVRLKTLPQLVVTLEAYSDELEDAAYGSELRKARVDAMVNALLELDIPKRRIVTTTSHDKQTTSASCASEYCRQSYRRVRLEFSRTSSH